MKKKQIRNLSKIFKKEREYLKNVFFFLLDDNLKDDFDRDINS